MQSFENLQHYPLIILFEGSLFREQDVRYQIHQKTECCYSHVSSASSHQYSLNCLTIQIFLSLTSSNPDSNQIHDFLHLQWMVVKWSLKLSLYFDFFRFLLEPLLRHLFSVSIEILYLPNHLVLLLVEVVSYL